MAKRRAKKPTGTSGRRRRRDDRPRAEGSTKAAAAKRHVPRGGADNGTARVSAPTRRPSKLAAKEFMGKNASPAVGKRARTQSASLIRAQAAQNTDLAGRIQHETVALIRGDIERCIRGGIAEIREEVKAALHVEARKAARWLSLHCKAERGALPSTAAPPESSDNASNPAVDAEYVDPQLSDAILKPASRTSRDDSRAYGVMREPNTSEGAGIRGSSERIVAEADAERQVVDDLYACGTDKPYDLLVLMFQAGAIASRGSSCDWDYSGKPFTWKTAYSELDRRTIDNIRKRLVGEDLFIIEPNPISVSEEAATKAKRKTRQISRGGYLTPRGEKVARDELARREQRKRSTDERK
jgi:hypothetical protein